VQAQLDQLARGQYHGTDRNIVEASDRLQHASQQRWAAANTRAWPALSRRQQRHWARDLDRWTNAETLAQQDWSQVTKPETERLTGILIELGRDEQRSLRRSRPLTHWLGASLVRWRPSCLWAWPLACLPLSRPHAIAAVAPP
jgi:hypothetical protein